MLQTIRKLMPYGHLQVSVKNKQWLLEFMIICNGIPGHKVYMWSNNLESGLKELLKRVQEDFHKLLKEIEDQKKIQNLFEDN